MRSKYLKTWFVDEEQDDQDANDPLYLQPKFVKVEGFKNSWQLEAKKGYHNHTLFPYFYFYKFYRDNIGYVVVDPLTSSLLAFDPGDYNNTAPFIRYIERKHNANLRYIFNTHHHPKHTHDNLIWYDEKRLEGEHIEIWASVGHNGIIPGQTHEFDWNETKKVGDIEVLYHNTPGHTERHLCYEI